MNLIAIITAFVVATGGVGVAAQGSLPGDALYNVKTTLNERVGAMANVSGEAKADYAQELASKRLLELERLSARGELSADVRSKIQANFEKHAEKVGDISARLEEKDNFEALARVQSNLESSLKAHEQVLARIQQSGESEVDLTSLIASVKSKIQAAEQKRAEAEANASANAEASAEVRAKNAEDQAETFIEQAEKRATQASEKLSIQLTSESEAKLQSANTLFAEAQADLEAEAYADAYAKFREVVRMANQVKTTVISEARRSDDAAEVSAEARGGAQVDIETGQPEEAEEDETKEDENAMEDKQDESDDDESMEEDEDGTSAEAEAEARSNAGIGVDDGGVEVDAEAGVGAGVNSR